MCSQMGHWKKDCPLLANLLPAQTTAVSTGPTPTPGHQPPPPFPTPGGAPRMFYSTAGPPQAPFYPNDSYYARAPPDQGNFFATV